jgi:hypothetical protein
MPSRGLFINCNLEDSSSPIESVVSPKSLSQIAHNKNIDMPVKRIDNYMKDQSKIGGDKKSKKGEVRKREFSEPNLTPKSHMKVENERKVVAKNGSILGF